MSCCYCHFCERNIDTDFEEMYDDDYCMVCYLNGSLEFW